MTIGSASPVTCGVFEPPNGHVLTDRSELTRELPLFRHVWPPLCASTETMSRTCRSV